MYIYRRYTSPALAAANYPFVYLPPGITLRCKLFPSDKFYEIRLYFLNGKAYNKAINKFLEPETVIGCKKVE